MIDLSKKQIDALRSDPALGLGVAANLEDPSLTFKPAVKLSDSEWDDLHDACSDVLFNDAPLVESFEAAQSNGPYLVSILGVPGAYFVTAQEFSPVGAFSTLEEARACADSDHGEFRVGESENVTEEEEWEEPDPFEPNFPSELLAALGGTSDSGVIRMLKERIVSEPTLILLANGTNAPDDMPRSEEVSELLADFESSLPKPQGAIAGMAQKLSKLPRLCLRVELFLRVNGRLPDHKETAVLYDIQ